MDTNDFRKEITQSCITDSIFVQAGPGSGKTKLLIDRLKYIIENRPQSFQGIACITYTNAAKDEIIDRLQKDGVQLPNELFIGTIHSFLLEYIIRPYSHFFQKDRIPYKLASPGFSRLYKSDISKWLNRPVHFISESMLNAFESLGRNEQGKSHCYLGKIPADVAHRWKKTLLGAGYIDQQEVIYLSVCILKEYQHIREAISSRFPYILIDEYQDVTFHQDQFFLYLEKTSIFGVGDVNQSIYSFTGAKPELFQLKLKAKQSTSYKLTNNYRSTGHIVEFANQKTFSTQNKAAGLSCYNDQKVLFIKGTLEEADAIKLFQLIRRKISCQESSNSFMILARENEQVMRISSLLKEEDGEMDTFLQKLKIESYRRYQILNNILLAISYKKRNDFDLAIEKINEAFSYLFFNVHSHYMPLHTIGYNKFMWKKLQIFTLAFLDNLPLNEISIADLFLELKEYLLQASRDLYGIPVGNNTRMLNYTWKNQKKAAKETMATKLIEQLESRTEIFQKEINVFSIHGAKGREAEAVLVMAESEDQLLKWLEKNENSEEARVGYVAFSRARTLLCIWAPSIREENYLYLQKHITFVNKNYEVEINNQ